MKYTLCLSELAIFLWKIRKILFNFDHIAGNFHNNCIFFLFHHFKRYDRCRINLESKISIRSLPRGRNMCSEDDDILPSMTTLRIQMIKPFHHLHSSDFLSSLLLGFLSTYRLTNVLLMATEKTLDSSSRSGILTL